MLRRPNFRSLRGRLFLALFLTAAIPAGLLLVGGSLVIREVVVGTGSAGPWDEVAASGRDLLSRIEEDPAASPALREAAEHHRAQLSESLRFSRLYAYLGERVLFLLPAVAGGLFLLAAGLSLWSAKQVSYSLSRPVREIVRWTEALGRGEPLPPDPPDPVFREVREIRALRDGLRAMEGELAAARARELREARNRSWSEMARRIAHDLKNPLTPMQMAAQRVARSSDPGAAEAGEVLLDEIARLDELSRSFAQFGRPPEGPPSVVELGELLQTLVRRVDPSGERVTLRLPDGETLVLGHPVALERVVRNLVVNALDAHAAGEAADPGGPPLQVEVRLRRVPPSSLAPPAEFRPDPANRGGMAEIQVEDRGPGLPAGEEDRIWEPDFSTKRRGTGLGLPLVRQVVEAHEGSVAATHRKGGGASFLVRLPLHPAPGEPRP